MISLKLSFLQITPKVWADKNNLYARTSRVYRFLNFFSYSRTVVVDRIKKHIEIKVKTFWFFTSKKYVPFSDIKYIDIEKERSEGGDWFSLPNDASTSETWNVQVIKNKSSYPEILIKFTGNGGADGYTSNLYSNLPYFDFVGMQYEKASSYAEQVSRYTESQLYKDRKIELNVEVDHYRCLKCGHVGTSKIKCIYCGGQEMETMG